MSSKFAPNHRAIPQILRSRIESWQKSMPSSQFQQYGPINMLLTAIFPNDKFIVKPQALYRPIYTGTLSAQDMETLAAGHIDPDGEGFSEFEDVLDRQRLSIDSAKNVVVQHLDQGKRYPDFAVTVYGDLIQREPPENPVGAARLSDDGDVTRIILEIASVPRKGKADLQKREVLFQLRSCMEMLGNDGDKWYKNACGIAIVGTEFAQLFLRKKEWTKSAKWHSIYDSKFIQVLESYAKL